MDPKKQRRMAGVLVAVAALIWVWGLMIKHPQPKATTSSASRFAPLTPTLSPEGRGKKGEGVSTSRYADWGGNPFEMERRAPTPASASGSMAAPMSSFVVSGILWDSKAPSAIVNGRLVGAGDDLGGWKVIEVHKDHIILSDGTTTQTLALK